MNQVEGRKRKKKGEGKEKKKEKEKEKEKDIEEEEETENEEEEGRKCLKLHVSEMGGSVDVALRLSGSEIQQRLIHILLHSYQKYIVTNKDNESS